MTMMHIHPRTLWLAVAVVITLFLAGSVGLANKQWHRENSLLENATSDELKLLASLVENDLRLGEYQHVDTVLNEWGKHNPEVVTLQLIASNGFTLGEYLRSNAATRSLTRKLPIEYSYAGKAHLILIKDMTKVYDAWTAMILQLVVWEGITAAMIIFLTRTILLRQEENTKIIALSASLRESEERFRQMAQQQIAILNALPAHIALLDPQGVIICVNEAWRRFANANALQSSNCAVGQNYIEICDRAHGEYSNDASTASSGIRRVLCSELTSFEMEYPCHSPSELRWFRFMVTPVSENQCVGAVLMHINVTERRLAEEALRVSERKSRALFDQTFGFIGLLKVDGTLIEVNRSALEFAGTSHEQVVGRLFWDTPWWNHSQEIQEQIRKAVQTAASGQLVRIETTHPVADGTTHTVDFSLKPVRDESGKVVLLVPEGRDITELKRAEQERGKMEQQLFQSQKMDAIGKLAGGVAHDFNNQLSVILGFAGMMVPHLSDPKLKRYAENICKAAQRSADLTKNLLAFARKGQYQTVLVQMHPIIAETIDMLNRTIDKRITVKHVFKAGSDLVLGDPSQLQNALLNLGVNARDAMPKGGMLVFETENVEVSGKFIARHGDEIQPGSYIKVSVSDTGTGMTEEVKKHLFEPFFTTKPVGKGTGLGLASVFGTVKNHRGTLDVYSELGHGSTFKIYLPLVEHPKVETSKTNYDLSPEKMNALKNLRVLFVEDEEIIRLMFRDMIESTGLEFLEAENGRQGVEIYQKHWQQIDVVILDMIMPEMDGSDAFRAMKKINPNIKALVATGYSLNNEIQQILDEGVRDFIQKPFMINGLIDKILQTKL